MLIMYVRCVSDSDTQPFGVTYELTGPVLAPVLAVGDELDVPAGQRVERVRHPGASVPIERFRCS